MATATLSTNPTNENHPSRRTILSGAAATLPVVALANPANAATGLTDPAIAAYSEWKRLSDEADAADLAFEHLHDIDQEAYWRALNRHREEWDDSLERQALWTAITMPAVSFEGLLCKARLVDQFHGSCSIGEAWQDDMQRPEFAIIRELIIDLQRLSEAAA